MFGGSRALGKWPVWAPGELAQRRSNHYMCNVWELLGAQTVVFVMPGRSMALKVLVSSNGNLAPAGGTDPTPLSVPVRITSDAQTISFAMRNAISPRWLQWKRLWRSL